MSEPRVTNEAAQSAPVFSSSTPAASPLPNKKAYVVVLGNEKGGSGKTTTCMHLIVSLLRLGFTVGTIDIDARQRSLSRYLENRRQTMLKEGVTLPQPQHVVIQRSPFNIVQEAEEDERERFTKALSRLIAANDFVVVDSPGSDTFLARVAHAYADTIITPINDSFVDLDVLATVDGQTMKIIKPSIYSEMVWEQKLQRAKRDGGSIEWIVMRNRLSNIDAKNKRFMTQVTTDLSRRIGFRVAPGFSERVIFREMFLQGLTVLDIMEAGGNASLSMSHVAARQEVRDLLKTLNIPLINDRIAKVKGDNEEEKLAAATAAAAPVVAGVSTDAPVPVVSSSTAQPITVPAGPTLGDGVPKSSEPVISAIEPVKAPEAKIEMKVVESISVSEPLKVVKDADKVSEKAPEKAQEKILEDLAS